MKITKKMIEAKHLKTHADLAAAIGHRKPHLAVTRADKNTLIEAAVDKWLWKHGGIVVHREHRSGQYGVGAMIEGNPVILMNDAFKTFGPCRGDFFKSKLAGQCAAVEHVLAGKVHHG